MGDAFLSAADAGLPSVDSAFVEAAGLDLPRAWSHRAVYIARQEARVFKPRNGSARNAAFRRFRPVYEGLCERVIAGEVLPALCYERVRPMRSAVVSPGDDVREVTRAVGVSALRDMLAGLK